MARILLADENALVLDLMQIFLAADGHELMIADQAAALFGLLEEAELRPDLLVLSADLDPGFASELVADARTLAPGLPVLVTVPPGSLDAEHDLAGLLSVEILAKPFDRGAFLARVRGILLLHGAPHAEPAPGSSEAPDPAPSTGGAGSASAPNASLGDLAELEMGEHIRAWLAEEGRAIIHHEVHAWVQESGRRVLEQVAWKVVPELAESLLRDEIRRITEELEN